jgi:two-component system LytT family sensor kinase
MTDRPQHHSLTAEPPGLAPAPGPAARREPPAPRRPGRNRWRNLAIWVASVLVLGVLLFLYHYLASLAIRQPDPPLKPFIEELTGAFVAGLLFFAVRTLVRRLPLSTRPWPTLGRRLAVYLAALPLCGAAATTLMWGLRSLLFPLAGLGAYDYGVMPLRYLMELPMQAIWFTLVVAALHGFAALDAARARELRAARIESSLARAQLHNLRLQLQPHFLFNALHTISAAMYDDPATADEMLDQLAELLRASLRTARHDEVALAEELALLDRYVALQRARFGERLEVRRELDPAAAALPVPSLLLQPLVENAIRHGNAERTGRGVITVRAHRAGSRLILEVEDDGPGRSGETTPAAGTVSGDGEHGLGLAATAERLQLLYGDAQTFSAANAPDSGFLVRITLPARPAGPGTAAAPPVPAQPARAAGRETAAHLERVAPEGR